MNPPTKDPGQIQLGKKKLLLKTDMDPITSLMNTFSHDVMGEFHPACLDTFCNQSSPYSMVPFGHRSSVNNQGQMEFNPPSYSQSTNQQFGHSVPQSFQPNLSDRQMTSAFMCPNQPQLHTDNFYPFQAQTPPFFPQKHQPGPHQVLQSPTSPCLSQTAPVNIYQSHSPQFASMSACPQNSQISPRHSGHHQSPQVPLLCSQNNQQIQSLQNQQHQQPSHMNGSIQPQRLEQSSKLVVSKQANSPKDRISDQFYSTHCPQITDPSLSSFSNMMQPTSPAHVPHVFQPSGSNSGSTVNSDSWSRSLHGGKLGASGNTHSINQTQSSTYYNCFDQPTSTVPSSVQLNRYGKNESITTSSQRIQKASPASSGLSYRPQVPSNPNFFADHNILPAYGDITSNHSIRSVHSKVPPQFDPSVGDLSSFQNMHYKPLSSHISREGKHVSNQGKISSRSTRPVTNDSFLLESHLSDSSHSNRMNNTNSSTLFSQTSLNESPRGVGRGGKIKDTTIKGGSRTNGPGKIVQKSMSDNVSPVHWYKCPGTTGASSFQSDIEAMQADVASYVSSSVVSRTSSKATPVTHGTSAQKATEPNTCSKNVHNRTSQAPDAQKSDSFFRTEGQSSDIPTSESHFTNKVSRAEALAAIQIKQELVDNLTKYKTVSSGSAANNISTKTALPTQSTNQISNVNTHSNRDTNNLKNKLSTVKDTGGTIHPKSDISARRHSSAEYDPRTVEIVQHPGPLANIYLYTPTSGKTSTTAAKTAADNYPQDQKIVGNINGGHHIQSRRHTASYLPDRASSISRYETTSSPDQRHSVEEQRSPAQRQTKGNKEFPSQSIIHHLFDQVQSIDMQYSSGQQQNMTTPNKAVPRDYVGTMDRNEQLVSVPYDKNILPASENGFDKWATGHVAGSLPGRGADQFRGHIAAPIANKNLSKSSDSLSSITKCPSVPIAMKENIEQVPNAVQHNSKGQVAHMHKIIKMEHSNEPNRPITVVCYVMLHGHKLICLKSNVETLLLLCQFQSDCFPDRSMGTINTCIDNILQINRKVLNHQDKEKIVLFLKRNEYHFGSMVQTISLDDAKRVYHHLYGITFCTNPACVVEMFQNEVDLDVMISSNIKPVTKEPKREKMSADDKIYGQLDSRIDSVTSSSAGKQLSQKITEKTKQIKDKPQNSHLTTALLPLSHRGFGNPDNGYTVACGKNVDCEESDDLIIVETPEDPNILRWTGNGLKTGGLCNTIVGQLRSYTHESERFLVVDDLCKVFGSADFYDGVERENIILYSCCPEIASFLNSISANFSPLQSLRDSLVKQTDIGIHVTDTNSVPVTRATEKSILGSSFLKRPLCKQEIVDDDCSSPKQFRFEDFAQVSESGNQQSIRQQPLAMSTREPMEESIIDKGSSDHKLADVSKLQNYDNPIGRMEGVNNKVPVVCSKISSSVQVLNPPLTSPGQSGEDNNNQIGAITASLEATVKGSGITPQVANSAVASNSSGKNSMSSTVIKSSNQTFENNNDREPVCTANSVFATVASLKDVCLKMTQHLAQERHYYETPAMVDCDIPSNAGISSDLVNMKEADGVNIKEADSISLAQPLTPESSRSITSFGEPSPILIDLNNPSKALSADGEKIEQNILKNNRPEFVSCNDLFDSLLGGTVNISSTPSLNTSVQQPADSEGTSMIHANIHLETIVCNQAENVEIIHHTNGSADNCMEDFISPQQNANQEKVVINPTSSILKTRVEKLKKALETRRNKDLPLPRLILDNCLGLDILIKDGCNAKDKNVFIDTSKTETVAQKLNNADHNTVDLNSPTKRPTDKSDIICMSSVIHPAISDKKGDNSDLFCLSEHTVATKYISQVSLPDPSENQTKDLPQEISRNHISTKDQNKDQALLSFLPLSFLPLSRYFQGNHRSMDDTDVVFTSSINLPGIRGAFAKLWHEHRELLGDVDALKKSLAHEKAEKEKCEKISKYYEGVIHDITSTFKNGDEGTPAPLSDN